MVHKVVWAWKKCVYRVGWRERDGVGSWLRKNNRQVRGAFCILVENGASFLGLFFLFELLVLLLFRRFLTIIVAQRLVVNFVLTR